MEVPYRNIRHMLEERARKNGDQVYMAFYDREITFRALQQDAFRLAHALLEAGVAKGDIVYVYQENSPEFLISALAANSMGAVAGPLNTWLKGREIAYQLNDSRGRALVIDEAFLPLLDEIRPQCPHLKTVVQHGGPLRDGHLSFQDLLASHPPDAGPEDISEHDPAYVFYTSGTTGHPKGALLSHRNILFEFAALREALELPGDDPARAVGLIFLPFFHVNACMSMLAGVYRGIKTAALRKFSVREFGPTVERHRASFFSAVPQVYKILLQARDTVSQSDLSSLKYGICGAAPMPVETIRQFQEAYGVEILEGYGLTEGTVATTLQRRNEPKKIGSIGRPLPGQKVRIMDPVGRFLPAGEVGEIVVQGPNVMLGYLGLPHENARTLRDGWLHTGDRGYADEDGDFFIVDREKDMIIKGGENIYPKEIENVISEHPAVCDVAVIGVPDELTGEEVKAFVVPRFGLDLTEEEIREYCRAHLAEFKVPGTVELVAGLPASAVGKVLKRLLRKGEGITRLSELNAADDFEVDGVFQMMPLLFKPEKAGAWKARIRYHVFGPGGGIWTLRVENGAMTVAREAEENPTVTVKVYAQTLMKIVTRELEGMAAVNSGLMQIEGSQADAAMFYEVLE